MACGVTSNPTIFEKAIDDRGQYDDTPRESSARNPSAEPGAIYDEIATEDVRNAADVLRPVYEASGGADGFASIEPPPQLTGDTRGTIREARRVHRIVNRPNMMIKWLRRVQRPLWAGTSAKNPSYSDVLYVEELIGPDTVNAIPPDTMDAFRNHGRVRGETVLENPAEAQNQLRVLSILGIHLNAITGKLQVDGVASFASAYDRVLRAIGKKVHNRSHVPV